MRKLGAEMDFLVCVLLSLAEDTFGHVSGENYNSHLNNPLHCLDSILHTLNVPYVFVNQDSTVFGHLTSRWTGVPFSLSITVS